MAGSIRRSGGFFDFSSNQRSQLSSRDASRINDAYSRARKRQRNEKIIKILIIVAIVTVVSLYCYSNYDKITPLIKDKMGRLNTAANNFSEDANAFVQTVSEPIQNMVDSNAVEQDVFQSVNESRSGLGLQTLNWNDALAGIARAHSKDMLENNFFDHTNLQGEDPDARATKAGIQIRKNYGSYTMVGIAENISEVPIADVIGCGVVGSSKDVADCAMAGWKSSPGHWANITNTEYSDIGVGVACNTDKCLLTQDFQ